MTDREPLLTIHQPPAEDLANALMIAESWGARAVPGDFAEGEEADLLAALASENRRPGTMREGHAPGAFLPGQALSVAHLDAHRREAVPQAHGPRFAVVSVLQCGGRGELRGARPVTDSILRPAPKPKPEGRGKRPDER